MKLLPLNYFEIELEMSAETVASVLAKNIEPRNWLRFSKQHGLFEGSVSSNGFKICRIIDYRNSFLPVVIGTLHPCSIGTRIQVKMRLHHLATLFMSIWFGGVSLGIAGALKHLNRNGPSVPQLIPFGMAILGYAMVTWGFWFEAKKTKQQLITLLKNEGGAKI